MLVQFSSVAQLCPTLYDPMNHRTPGLPVHHQLPEFTQTHVHGVGDAIHHLILCHPLLLLPPIFPSIRVFSNESTLRMRRPKYWNFSFSIIPSKEHPGLISFWMDWLHLLTVQGTLKSLLLCCCKRVFAMTCGFSWQNSVSLFSASFCTPRPKFPVTPCISWLPIFAFQYPKRNRTFFFFGVRSRRSCSFINL